MSYEPTEEDKQYLNQVDQGFIGLTKPKVQITKEPNDPYIYQRWQGAKKLGLTPDQLEDEPDEMSDHSDDQGWDIEETE